MALCSSRSAFSPCTPTSAAAVATLRSPPSIVVPDQAMKSPVSKASPKMTSAGEAGGRGALAGARVGGGAPIQLEVLHLITDREPGRVVPACGVVQERSPDLEVTVVSAQLDPQDHCRCPPAPVKDEVRIPLSHRYRVGRDA